MPYRDIYRDKTVLITGHTGFKGSWLTAWLLTMGAKVVGYSLDPPSTPSNFEVLGLEQKITHVKGDVRDLAHLSKVFEDTRPEVVFHLAAQAITRRSYDLSQETFHTNLLGTVNILECAKNSSSLKAAVMITSDKCYQNVEWVWGYRENDRLGGDDPYSASKACAEIAAHSYIKSFFSKDSAPGVATARAGNVIGGGDWAADRIVPDCVRAFAKGDTVETRSPKATRPWQHVLEPLSGYLWVGANLLEKNSQVRGESFNFGPLSDVSRSVQELIVELTKNWEGSKWAVAPDADPNKKEAMLLQLSFEKASHVLGWRAVLPFSETVEMTASWYKTYYGGEKDMYGYTTMQIEKYMDRARECGLVWALKPAERR